jgi:tetratricopeptide (TPR) repeat protein
MDDNGISIEEANSIIKELDNGLIKVGNYTLMDWVITVLRNIEKSIDKRRFMNEFFLLYLSTILESDPLFIEFKRVDYGVFSKDISDTLDILILTDFIKITSNYSYENDSDIFEIQLSEKGIRYYNELNTSLKNKFTSFRSILNDYDAFSDNLLKEMVFSKLQEYSMEIDRKSSHWMKVGQQLFKNDQLKKALVYYNRVLQINSDDADAWEQKSIIYTILKDDKSARICHDKSKHIKKIQTIESFLKNEIIQCILYQLEKGSQDEYGIYSRVSHCIPHKSSKSLPAPLPKVLLDAYLEKMLEVELITSRLKRNRLEYQLTKSGLDLLNKFNKISK